tara:strand:- start:356 stop:1843 length:1488 start_codon:yes stop_codon:yes gene_type:complete
MYQLRKYQTKSIEDMSVNYRKGLRKLLLVAPTGSGKTVVASEVMRRVVAGGKQCLFIAHRRELIMQCSRKLYDFGVSHGILMAGKSPTKHAAVQVASIQTLTARKDKHDFDLPPADLIILDEAHRSVSTSFQELIDLYPDSYIVGLTATPCRSDGRGLGDVYQKIIECSNIKELTDNKFLVPSRIIAPTLPDLKGIKITAGDYDAKMLNKRMNVPKLVGDLVEHWNLYANDRPTVVFATSIAHSKYIANIFRQNGIPAGHIDGEMKETEREKQLEMLESGDIKVLSNCQVLTEGWDCPKVSCVILARPTKSYGLYLQMVGRSLRPYKNKKDTLIIDHSGAVYEHGFPDEPPTWSLQAKKRDNRKPNKPRNIENQPYTCVECNTVYKPTKNEPECPMCLHVPTKKEKAVLIKQGRLIEVTKKEKVEPEHKKHFYGQVLYYARQKGYNDGWASWIFKDKYKHFPANKQVSPISPSKDVLNYIKHYNIKKAKAMEANK